MDPIKEEDEPLDLQQALNFELEALKEGIYKRDLKITELQDSFNYERERSDKLAELLKLEEARNEAGEETIKKLKTKLAETDDLMHDLRDRFGAKTKEKNEGSSDVTSDELQARISAGEQAIKELQNELARWKSRCGGLESQLSKEREALQDEKLQHEQVKFKLAQSEELLRTLRDETYSSNGDEGTSEKFNKIISGLKASIDVQSQRNIELNQELQRIRKDAEDGDKLLKSLQEKADKDQKLIEELNNQNEREYQKNEKLRGDIHRLKRDIDSWKKIQLDMKTQYQDLRTMYDGVCKHADEQKREMLEMKLLMDRDKRSIARQRDEIDKLKGRVASHKQTYDDLKGKYDENFKLLEEKKYESRMLGSQLQTAKKTVSELQASNKDLKKRSDFSQKELIERHKLLIQTEEQLKDLESTLEEKNTEVEESQKMMTEAMEKAEKHSQEAANKEKDLLDRIALIQNLQAQIQALNEDVKTRQREEERLKQVIEEKDKMIERRENDLKDKESAIYEQEQKVSELEKLVEEMEKLQEAYKGELKRIEADISEKEANMDAVAKEIVEKDNEILEAKRKFEELTNDLKAKQDEFESEKGKEDEAKREMREKIEDLLKVEESKDEQIQQLNEELEEERKRVHLQNQLLKELELKFEDEDLKMIEYEENLRKKNEEISELKMTLEEKDRVMEELKRELEESAVIQVYLQEIEDLNKAVLDERSQKDELKQKLENIHLNGNDDVSRVEEEKKEVMLQMTKELKRERQTSQSMMNDLKEDIRVLECNVENEKERSLSLERELELKNRQLKNERESLLEHVEELQLLLSDEKREKQEYKDKVEELEKQIREIARKRESEIEEYENKHLQILAQKKSSLILDRQEKIEELKKEIGNKKDLLFEAERRLIEANKAREVEQIEVKILMEEKDNLIASLKRENSKLRKGWEKESQWMEENVLREAKTPVLVETKSQDQVGFKPKSDCLQDEAKLLEAQSTAIQKLKQKIHSDFNLDKILPHDEHAEERALDALHEANPHHNQPTATKAENIRILLQKLAIVMILSPLAYCLSCELCLTFGAVLVPLFFFIYQKPWKNTSDQERMLHDALNGLSLRLAAECSENENLHKMIENLKQQSKDGADSRKDDMENNKECSPRHIKSQSACRCDHHCEQEFAKERKILINELERQSKEEHEKQKDELLRIKHKQESDRRRLQRQQALIDKLEVILQEREIKSRLGQFWGYEELKMAIHRLKHEREVEKHKFEGSSDDGIQKRVAGVIDEAVSREKKRKFEALVVAVFFSAVLVVLFSLNSSSVLPVASSAIVAACSVFYAIRSWKEIENFRNKLQSEKNLVEAQSAEIKELSVLMDREYDVVNKQKQAIEVLERRLNDEYKKNKDHQLTIARLTWVFQESEEIRDLGRRLKDPNGVDTNPELRKLAEDHARDKFSVFKSMQRQLEEHSSNTEQQRKAIDDLKNATNVIVHAAEKQMSELKIHKENRPNDKTTKKVLGWKSLLLALAVVSSSVSFVIGEKKFAAGLPLVFAFIFGVIKLVKGRKKNRQPKVSEYHQTKIEKPSLQQPFSNIEQYGYDVIYVAALAVLCYYFKSLSFSVAVFTFTVVMVIRLTTYVLYRRKIARNMSSWNDVVEDLWSQIHERTQLIDVQTEEIQTLKQLLEVERSYSKHTERLLKEAKGVSDEGFVDIAEAEKLKKRADELEAEDARLVNYELDEMRIFLEEEKKTNVQLRKALAEVEETKRALNTEVTNLKRKLEMEQIRRKELNISKEEEGLLKDRIEELMEDLEAEQKTKQELSAQLIEERSCRELKQIELQDLKEKVRDEQHMNQSLREQVLRLARNDEEPKELRQQLSATRKELEEERLATQRQNLTLMEAIHKVREHNMILRRQVEDLRTSVKDDVMMQQLKEQSDVQQDEIENLQTLLEEISSTKKALKYQDLIEELQTLRQKIGTADQSSSQDLLQELELEREKNKILEEAVEELQRQQQDQRKMFEEERRRSIELARQLSGEDIPMMVEEESNDEIEDTRGVLYWLGTNGGLTDWKNPGESGLILISRSSYGHGRATDVANRKPSWCSTSNKPNQWWKIDFGDKRLVVPTAYSLRHGWSGNAGALRNWMFEGSVDGRKWTVLRHHDNDETIKTAYGFGYWKIPNPSDTGYRYVRVRQTGTNSSGRHALRLCGIEVYGKLLIE